MKDLNPYQINFLMAIGMLVTAVPALWFKQGDLAVPVKSLPLGAHIGLLMALGYLIRACPVRTAAAISTSYVILIVLLPRVFLDESLIWMKIIGILLTVIGVALLSWEQSSNPQ
jgi:drug/metabolite transporter (DMT)-like permease